MSLDLRRVAVEGSGVVKGSGGGLELLPSAMKMMAWRVDPPRIQPRESESESESKNPSMEESSKLLALETRVIEST